MADVKIRLQKYLASCGVASRRKCEELISQGVVKVNGHVAQIGDQVAPRDKITVHGKRVACEAQMVYIMLNKPRGFITTMQDERGRKCVNSLIEGVGARVFPVGRLDKDSEGLLLMTNDGELANRITHPSHHVPKTYRVTVRPDISEDKLDQMRAGMEIDGVMTAPAEVTVLTKEAERVVLRVTLNEGRNRQIRKMCEALGLEVARLKRITVGPVKLGMLRTGDWRELTRQEIDRLRSAAGLEREK